MPSVDPSSTTMSSMRSGTASTRRMISSTVVRSLYTGMTTDSSGLAGTRARGDCVVIESETVPQPRSGAVADDRQRLLVLAPELARRRRDGAAGDGGRCSRAQPGARLTVAAARPRSRRCFSMVRRSRRRSLHARSGGARAIVATADGPASMPRCCCRTRSTRRGWRGGPAFRERWGYRADWRSLLLTRASRRRSACIRPTTTSTSCGALGFPPGADPPRLDGVRRRSARRARRCLRRGGWDGRAPLVAMAPGAAFGGAKRWPADRFAALVDALSARRRAPCWSGARPIAQRARR